MVKIL